MNKYIYCHPQTDLFVLSELFSVATYAGRNPSNFTLGYVSDRSANKRTTLATRILKVFIYQQQQTFVHIFIPYRLPECSILSNSFALYERRPTIPSPECSTPMVERIYCHPQTDCFLRKSDWYAPANIYIYIYIYIYIFDVPSSFVASILILFAYCWCSFEYRFSFF